MQRATRGACLTLTAVLAGTTSVARAGDVPAAPLRYRFTAGERLVYDIAITAELPGGNTEARTGHLVLTVRSVDAATGQVTLSGAQRVRRSSTRLPGVRPVSSPSDGGGAASLGDLTIDDRGDAVGTAGGAQLPDLLGLVSQLAIEPLPTAAGQTDWQVQRPIEVKQSTPPRAGPASMFGRQLADEDHSAQEVDSYHVTGTAADGAVTVHKTYRLVTDDRVGGEPRVQQAGDGEFVFDAAAGRVRSVEERQTITVRQPNMAVQVPTTVSVHLLDPATARQALADDAAADAKARAEVDRRLAEQARADDAPAGDRTPLIGAHGGGPFSKAGSGTAPVLGVRYTLGSWGGDGCLRQVDPIYDRSGSTAAGVVGRGRPRTIMARDGYAVGGLAVEADDTNVLAFQVIFFRYRDGHLNPTDRYTSAMAGFPDDQHPPRPVGGDGRTVVGLYGRQGLNLAAIGLVMAPK